MNKSEVKLPDVSGRRFKTKRNSIGLSCSLQHGLSNPTGGLQIDSDGNPQMTDSYLKAVTQSSQSTVNIRSCEELAQEQKSLRQGKRERRAEKEKTKGRDWFNLPAPEMTDALKNDLKLIQMRKVLDPKRFYKGPDIRGALPKYFQMARVVETAADFYSGRIPKKQQKRTLVDELLADDEFRRYNKRKYEEIQSKQPKGLSKAYKHMKKLKKRKK